MCGRCVLTGALSSGLNCDALDALCAKPAEHEKSVFSLRITKCLLLACGAGVSIKPGVERGFASETPG